jgi:tRNA threonylcarbamoyladenosine biosynthesis protein TsaB
MLTLASDTSGKSLSVALCRDGRLLGETCLHLGYNHSITHMPQVMALLASCECRMADVDLFACTVGPGSFTGIRIGISAVKGMAYAANRPALGVSTLAVLAAPFASLPDVVICPLLDARNGRVYAAAYRGESILLPEANWLAADFLAELTLAVSKFAVSKFADQLPTLLFVGDGADAALASWQYPANLDIRRAPQSCDLPRASLVASLAERLAASGQAGDPQQLSASYLTQSSAERRQHQPDNTRIRS